MAEVPGTPDADTLVGDILNDHIFGGAGNDTLDGLGAADTLYGGVGDDRFLFHDAFGEDRVAVDEAGTDRVVLGAGISPEQVRLVHQGNAPFLQANDLLLLIDDGAGSRIRLDRHFTDLTPSVETLEFADGTSWSLSGGLSFAGGIGNDVLAGSAYGDTLVGAEGNDTLNGGIGNDRYVFEGAFGRDFVGVDLGGTDDRVVLGPDIAPDQVRLVRLGNAPFGQADDLLILVDDGAGSQVRLDQHFETLNPAIEKLEFADGTVWSLTRGLALTGSFGNDVMAGSSYGDTLIGAGGNDTLNGGTGDDRYLFDGAFGQDLVGSDIGGTDDRIVLGQGISRADVRLVRLGNAPFAQRDDLVLLIDDGAGRQIRLGQHFSDFTPFIEQLEFSDGRLLSLTGGLAFEGGIGNDVLAGSAFDDIYRFEKVSGRDVVVEDASGVDTVHFAGLRWSGARLVGVGESLVVSDLAGANAATLQGQIDGDGLSIERLQFSGGSVLDLSRGLVLEGTGTAGTSLGSRSADLFIDDGGNDVYSGGFGADGYVFAPGWGLDRVAETAGGSVIVFDGFTAGQRRALVQTRLGDDLAITSPGTTDRLLLDDYFAPGNSYTLRFMDAGYADRLLGGGGRDTLSGTNRGDIIDGRGGDDLIRGLNGQDQLIGGSGRDVFQFTGIAASAADTPDVILDFTSRSDRIDIHLIDADTGTPGDQYFDFIGRAAFRGNAGELRFRAGLLSADTNGDGVADIVVAVPGPNVLSSPDLIL